MDCSLVRRGVALLLKYSLHPHISLSLCMCRSGKVLGFTLRSIESILMPRHTKLKILYNYFSILFSMQMLCGLPSASISDLEHNPKNAQQILRRSIYCVQYTVNNSQCT